jgi:hypothetical protein
LQNASIDARNLDPDKLAALVKDYMESKQGSLYKVDLPDTKISKMLDWDKPLSQQAPEVQTAMDKAFQLHLGRIPQVNKDTFTGAQAYTMLTGGTSGMQGYENIAAQGSKALRQAGIPGIKYLDATSRGAGTGTRNFVTFPGEEKTLTILERNGQPMIARTQQQDATPDLLQYQQMLDDEERRKSAGLLFR